MLALKKFGLAALNKAAYIIHLLYVFPTVWADLDFIRNLVLEDGDVLLLQKMGSRFIGSVYKMILRFCRYIVSVLRTLRLVHTLSRRERLCQHLSVTLAAKRSRKVEPQASHMPQLYDATSLPVQAAIAEWHNFLCASADEEALDSWM
jgi:hypothetical protein